MWLMVYAVTSAEFSNMKYENSGLVSSFSISVQFGFSAHSQISFATFRIFLVMDNALASCIPSGPDVAAL